MKCTILSKRLRNHIMADNSLPGFVHSKTSKKRMPQLLKHNLNTTRSGQLAGTVTGRSSMSVHEGTNTHVATFPFKQGKEIFLDVRNFTNPQRNDLKSMA